MERKGAGEMGPYASRNAVAQRGRHRTPAVSAPDPGCLGECRQGNSWLVSESTVNNIVRRYVDAIALKTRVPRWSHSCWAPHHPAEAQLLHCRVSAPRNGTASPSVRSLLISAS